MKSLLLALVATLSVPQPAVYAQSPLQRGNRTGEVNSVQTNPTEIQLPQGNLDLYKIKLGDNELYYHIDTKACLCWMTHRPYVNRGLKQTQVTAALGTFSCQRLKSYPTLKKIVKKCQSKI